MSLLLRSWLAVACALPIVMLWALLIALVSRFRWRVSQWLLPILAGPAVVVLMLFCEIISGDLFRFRASREIFTALFLAPGIGSVTQSTIVVVVIAVHFLATVIISCLGLARSPEGTPRARGWSLRRLTGGFLGSVAFLALTFVLQNWIIAGIARSTAAEISTEAQNWLAPAPEAPAKGNGPVAILAVLEESAKSNNPAFDVAFSRYQPLRNVPVRKEIEHGNKLARLYFEALEGLLRKTPFRPASNDLLTWDRQELIGFEKLLNAARLAVIIAIEEADHERIVRYVNALALCSDQLRVIPDVDCFLLSMSFASTRSALLERWLAETSPPDNSIKAIVPLQSPNFASQREPMLRHLESTIIYEHSQFLAGKKTWSGSADRIWLVEHASSKRRFSPLFLMRVIKGADNLLIGPVDYARYRPRFLTSPDRFDGFGHIDTFHEWNGSAVLVSEALATMSTLCERAMDEDARESVTNVALQIARHRLQTKEFPAALIELVPKYLPRVPIDPYDGQPLRYLREGGTGATIYSVRRDRRDQQTGDKDFRGDRNLADILFCLGGSYPPHRIPKPEQ